MRGGIDLGGTKIEARLFHGPRHEELARRRVPTPAGGLAPILATVRELALWLDGEAGRRVPLGVAIPGIADAATGWIDAANLPRAVWGRELGTATGRQVVTVHDAGAFALSEAAGGAGAGHARVAGLILGTGLGAGLHDGRRALPVEVGHLGLSAATAARHGLAPLPCPCGQTGCIERYAAGAGLDRLSGGGAPDAAALDVWADCVADALVILARTCAPDIVVLGGGLSNLPGCVARLSAALAARRIGREALPPLALAAFGDASGARGAAILAEPC